MKPKFGKMLILTPKIIQKLVEKKIITTQLFREHLSSLFQAEETFPLTARKFNPIMKSILKFLNGNILFSYQS